MRVRDTDIGGRGLAAALRVWESKGGWVDGGSAVVVRQGWCTWYMSGL